MHPQEMLGRVVTADGVELVLYCRSGIYTIRVDGQELMSSRAHGSEMELARLACTHLGQLRRPRLLIGGLGMGYTVRAALDCLGEHAAVVVAEVFPAVVEWCRDQLADLTSAPLDDPRVRVVIDDVWTALGADRDGFNAILLDIDNGPAALTLASNRRLYGRAGLERMRYSLRPGGVLAVWSAGEDQPFARRLGEAGFRVCVEEVPVRPGRPDACHTVFIARR